MSSNIPLKHAQSVLETLKNRKETLSVAESCTGGWLSSCLVEPAGSSAIYLGSITSYNSSIKEEVLGIDASRLKKEGAVSSWTALEMAKGVQKKMGSTWAISTTGLAGPSVPDEEKEDLGTIYIAVVGPKVLEYQKIILNGTRTEIRCKATEESLLYFIGLLSKL